MSGLQLEHADPLFKRLSRSKLPDSVRAYTPEDIAEERWSRNDMFQLDPVFWEVRRMKPGRWANKKPKGNSSTLHLLDAQGHVLAMICEYDFSDGHVRVNESLVQRREAQTIIAHVEGAIGSNPARLTRLEWADSETDKPSLIEVRDLHWAMRSRLFYDGDRLIRIEREDEDTRLNAGDVSRDIITITYDAIGRRERVQSVSADEPNDPPTVLYQSTHSGPSTKEAAGRLSTMLHHAIIAAVRSMQINEPVWCVKLVYEGGGGTVLPPSVVACTQAKRAEILICGEPQEVWNETHYPYAHQVHELEAFADGAALAALVNVLETQSESKQVKLLRELASDLSKSIVADAIKPTDDFGIVAVDMPHDDLDKAIRASVPKNVVQQWKAAGII